MITPTKTFIGLIIIIGLTTTAAFYLSTTQTPKMPEPVEVTHEPAAPVDDSSMEINPQTAPFNAGDNEELKKDARFGFFKSIDIAPDTDSVSFKFDEALFLNEQTAKEQDIDLGCDKTNPPADCESLTNNGFYIYNPIPRLFTLSISLGASIKVIDMSGNGVRIKETDLQGLQQRLDDNEDPYPPFWIVEEDGVITQIEEQYIP